MILKPDCRHFPGDRPCRIHKETGVMCDTCTEYSPVMDKILIIKLDAVGDVLRTTSLLHSLKKAHPASHITWLTKEISKELFTNNLLVDDVLVYEDKIMPSRLSLENFDLIINLDPSPYSSALASAANGMKKIGFGLNEKGKVFPFNDEAVEWFEMGAFDNLKKANTKTYQQIIHEICSLPYDKGEIILELTPGEMEFKNNFIKSHALNRFDFIIGINAGASSRWEFKKWYLERYKKLIARVLNEFNAAILLYGGRSEKEQNSILSEIGDSVIDTGSDNTLRKFAALVDIADIVITGDTLALHMATALKKQVICLFGPTSHAEIEDYGRVTKVIPALDCLVCYKNTCDFDPNCMQSITVEMVYNDLLKAINTVLSNKIS